MTDTPSDETHLLIASMPFAASLGVQLDSAEAHEIRGHVPWSPERCTLGGALHGGVVMALADSLGGICAYLNLPEEASTATIDSASHFFRAVREGTLHGLSRPLHTGRTVITVQTGLYDDHERLVAQTTQTQAVIVGES